MACPGTWKALRDEFPAPKSCAAGGKIADVLAALAKSAHPGAKKALAEIYSAENKEQAGKAAKALASE